MFAVSKLDLKGKSRKRECEVVTLDSDAEEPTYPKRSRDNNMLKTIESKVDDIKEDVESIKDVIQDILHLNENIPVGLQHIIRDAFQCKICLTIPVKPPVIMSQCCKVIIGCEICVNGWYTGPEALTKTCPSCCTEYGYSETMVLGGLDSFLLEVKKVIQTENERDYEELYTSCCDMTIIPSIQPWNIISHCMLCPIKLYNNLHTLVSIT